MSHRTTIVCVYAGDQPAPVARRSVRRGRAGARAEFAALRLISNILSIGGFAIAGPMLKQPPVSPSCRQKSAVAYGMGGC